MEQTLYPAFLFVHRQKKRTNIAQTLQHSYQDANPRFLFPQTL